MIQFVPKVSLADSFSQGENVLLNVDGQVFLNSSFSSYCKVFMMEDSICNKKLNRQIIIITPLSIFIHKLYFAKISICNNSYIKCMPYYFIFSLTYANMHKNDTIEKEDNRFHDNSINSINCILKLRSRKSRT